MALVLRDLAENWDDNPAGAGIETLGTIPEGKVIGQRSAMVRDICVFAESGSRSPRSGSIPTKSVCNQLQIWVLGMRPGQFCTSRLFDGVENGRSDRDWQCRMIDELWAGVDDRQPRTGETGGDDPRGSGDEVAARDCAAVAEPMLWRICHLCRQSRANHRRSPAGPVRTGRGIGG